MTATDLLNTLPDAVVELDRAYCVVAVNATACRLTGYSVEQLVGQDCRSLLVARRRDGHRVWTDG
jgi:PAS domain S-box-containing protein